MIVIQRQFSNFAAISWREKLWAALYYRQHACPLWWTSVTGTNSAPLFSDLVLLAYEEHFLQGFLNYKDRKLTQHLLQLRYTDDVLPLNNT